MKKRSQYVRKMVISAMFIAIGLVLPFVTGQMQHVGNMLLPMHIPVMLCGLVCGWQYGAMVGFVLPLLRYFLFGMPQIYPLGISMAFELATYGAVIGGCITFFTKEKETVFLVETREYMKGLYRSLLISMLCGRLVWGTVRLILGYMMREPFTWKIFFAGAFLTAIPGILIQLLLIPGIMIALERAGILKENIG